MKKQIKFLPLCLFLLLPLQKAQAQTSADSFGELAYTVNTAPANPSQTQIVITTDTVISTGNINNINNKSIVISGSGPSGFTLFDGQEAYKGFTAAQGSSLTFNNMNFQNVYNSGNGGFLSLNNSSAAFNSSGIVSFAGGNAMDGGALYVTANSYVHFSTKTVFSGNISENQGGGFFVNSSRMVFDGDSEFNGNTADYEGGAFFSNTNSNIVFNATATFKNNSTAWGAGGGFNAHRSTITFAKAIFENNESGYGSGGGAFYSVGSTITFSKDAEFTSNKARFSGGAFAAGASPSSKSNITFMDNVLFSSNTASSYGGAISATETNLRFAGAATFTNNEAETEHGGAIGVYNNVEMLFEGASRFESNKAAQSGGAVYSSKSNITFSSSSYFGNNSADTGGAVYLYDAASLTLADAVFDHNSAASDGGAVYLTGGSVLTINNASFTYNTAQITGGAVYLDASDLIINTSSYTVFRNNKANGISNAMYISDLSTALFNTSSGADADIYDDITGSTNGYLMVSGEGDFNLRGGLQTVNVEIGDSGSGVFNLMQSGVIDAGSFSINSGAKFNMQNSKTDTVKVTEFTNNGTLAVDIFATGESDQIFSNGDVNLNATTSKLDVNTDITQKRFKKKAFKIINFGGTVSGEFNSVTLAGLTLINDPVINYGSLFANWITVSLIGDSATTNFSALSGLSFNQKETAKTFDKLSATTPEGGDLDAVISLIEGFDDNGQKKALAQASGYFLANAVRSSAADAENNEIYDRIKNHCVNGHSNTGLWVQLRGAATTYSKDDNSLNNYKDSSGGFMAGFDRFMADDGLMLGVYAKYNGRDIKQDPNNEADIKNTGIGFYGGLIKKEWEIKALLSGSYDNYNTERYIPFIGSKAKASFDGNTLGADIEGALKFALTEYTDFRPYAGLEAKNSHYNGFKEKGANSLNLDVLGGNYVRSMARVGAGAVYDNKIFSWYISGEAKYLISGEVPEIEGAFAGTDTLFRSRGATEDNMVFGALAGASVLLTKELKLFVNGNYYAAENFQNIYGNIGLRYTFCSLQKKEKPVKKEYDPAAALLAPAPPVPEEVPIVKFEEIPVTPPEPEPAPAPEPEPVKPAVTEIDMENEDTAAEQTLAAAKRREKPVLKAFSLNMANFATGKSALTEKAKENIRLQADEIKKFTFDKITIEGHTDSTGSAALNRKLSTERAKAVYEVFVEEGIPAEKISYIGFSSLIPVATNKTIDGRAQNRRVEIFVE